MAEKRSERQRRKEKIHPSECRVPKISKRKPALGINAKKQRKTIEWERLEILSKKTGDTKGTFHTKVGTVKDRKGKDLREAEDIKNKWQEYTEELY